ncbi:hypothetical protein [Schlesneria paludicola]|uniref:hypothetical protein n=1 Tax=Schlesneria paludicola TaxID=360056 RepID=UPI000299CF53|nr:hypothetical protein [Schlesneria paludicola]
MIVRKSGIRSRLFRDEYFCQDEKDESGGRDWMNKALEAPGFRQGRSIPTARRFRDDKTLVKVMRLD